MTKIGVVGIGSMGKNHARVLSEISELAGVVDISRENRDMVSSKYGVPGFETLEEMLSEEVDAVVVATPTESHYDVAKNCLNRGKHVLVEKPVCQTPTQAKELIKLAEDAGLVFAVGQIERHNPVVGAAKEKLKDGAFGDLLTLSSKRVSSFPARIRDVGVIMDLGIHDIDAMRYLSGSEVVSVCATAGLHSQDRLEKYGNILLQFENGVSGSVEVNWVTPMKIRKLWLTCSKDYVELDYMNQALRVSSSTIGEFDANDLFRIPYEYHIRDFSLKKTEPLRIELMDFLNAVENGTKPLVDGRDGTSTLEVALAAIQSYRKGERITLC